MKSIRKHLLTARTVCGFSSSPNSSLTMMMESRPRVSKRTLVVGVVVVIFVTFIVLITEGILTFNTETDRTGLMIDVGTTSEGDVKQSKVEKADSSSSSSTKASKEGAEDDTPSRENIDKDAVLNKDTDDEDSSVEASVSGVESCKSQPDNAQVSTSKCHACGTHDKLHVVECAETGSVEQSVTCVGGKPTQRKHRPCRRRAKEQEEERKFIVFEAVNLGMGVVAYVVVSLRRKKLDSALAKKIEQQLASGV